MKLRQVLVSTHLVVGCIAAPILIILGLSGAALVFEDEIEAAANSTLLRVAVTGPALSLPALEAHIDSSYPGFHLTAASFGTGLTSSWSVSAAAPVGDSSVDLLINPYTGRILGTADQEHDVMRWVHLLHTRLLAGNNGQTVVAITALLLGFLSASGLVLWWRSMVIGVAWQGSRRRVMFDLHNTIGGVAWLFLGSFAVTASVIHWDRATGQWLARLTHSAPVAQPPRTVPPCTTGSALPLGQLLSIAEAQVPGARATNVMLQDGVVAPVRVIFKFPEDRTPAGRTQVFLAPCSGAVLLVRNFRMAPFSFRYTAMWNRMIHTGDLFGWPTRILAALMSLSLPLLGITGPLIWWFRRQSRKKGDTGPEAA